MKKLLKIILYILVSILIILFTVGWFLWPLDLVGFELSFKCCFVWAYFTSGYIAIMYFFCKIIYSDI